MNQRPLRILTISKPYVALSYRDKFRVLAGSLPGSVPFEVGVITPPAWAGQRFEPDAASPPYWLKQVPIAFDGRNHFHCYRGLASAIREFRPDLINAEEEHYSLVTWQILRIAQRLGVPAIFYTWQNILKSYPPPFSWTEAYVLKHAAAAVAGNQEAAQVLRAKGFQGPIREIPQMGVDTRRFAPINRPHRLQTRADLGLDPDGFWVGFIGRLVEEKGVQLLLESLVGLPSQVRALILGNGPYKSTIEAMVRRLGLGERVKLIPSVPSDQVPKYLGALDALCLPSLTRPNWKEQFGRVLIEAMAANVVTIGSASGEIPNVLGDAGIVVPEGDSRAIKEALIRLVASPGLVADLQARGGQRVAERFTNEIVAQKLAALVGETLKLAQTTTQNHC